MNEQEAQKVSFKKWGDFNKNSLSIDHKNGHEQGARAIMPVKKARNKIEKGFNKNGGTE